MTKCEELQERRAAVKTCQLETQAISKDLFERQTINQERFDLLKHYIQKLTVIIQEWINELSRHVFPIERVLTIEEFVPRKEQGSRDFVRSFV